MKKRISLALLVLTMILSLVGCSGEKSGIEYNQADLEYIAEIMIGGFSQMDAEDFEQYKELSEYKLDYTMMTNGLPVSGENFIGMINSWEAAELECGEYISHGEYTIEEKTSSIVVSTLAEYEDREATISFSFDENLNMESMDVSAQFTVSEILTKAGLNTLLGMGTVFAVLIFLAFLISLMKYIPAILEKMNKKEQASVQEVKQEAVVAPVVEETTDDLELIAVITAAIAAQEGTSTDGFVVRSIRRRPSNKWN